MVMDEQLIQRLTESLQTGMSVEEAQAKGVAKGHAPDFVACHINAAIARMGNPEDPFMAALDAVKGDIIAEDIEPFRMWAAQTFTPQRMEAINKKCKEISGGKERKLTVEDVAVVACLIYDSASTNNSVINPDGSIEGDTPRKRYVEYSGKEDSLIPPIGYKGVKVIVAALWGVGFAKQTAEAKWHPNPRLSKSERNLVFPFPPLSIKAKSQD